MGLYGHLLRPHNSPAPGNLIGKHGKPALCGLLEPMIPTLYGHVFFMVSKLAHICTFATPQRAKVKL